MTIEIVDLPIENGGSFHGLAVGKLTVGPWKLPGFNGNESSNPDDCQGLC